MCELCTGFDLVHNSADGDNGSLNLVRVLQDLVEIFNDIKKEGK